MYHNSASLCFPNKIVPACFTERQTTDELDPEAGNSGRSTEFKNNCNSVKTPLVSLFAN